MDTSLWTFVLRFVGAATLYYIAYKLISFHSLWLIPTRSITYYQLQNSAWALVTGASAGIGRGCAEELASRGFNVILLGHLPDELQEVKRSIGKESPNIDVKIIVLDVTQATNAEVETAFNEIVHLPITVLVNNVGGGPSGLKDYVEQSAVDLDRTIELNARFMAQCTRIMLPVLAKHTPALMMNLSSIGRLGMPNIVSYSGTKAFVAAISRGLSRECRSKGEKVDVITVLPVEVATEQSAKIMAPGTPNSRTFGKAMMEYVPRAASRGWLELCPYWPHAVRMAIMESLPESIFLKTVVTAFEQKKAMLKADQSK